MKWHSEIALHILDSESVDSTNQPTKLNIQLVESADAEPAYTERGGLSCCCWVLS